jgi:hypothetical protein
MALLTPDDIQQALNIDLTNPQGRDLAASLIKAAVAYVEAQLGFPVEARQVTSYFSGEYPLVWLPTAAPVQDVTLATASGSTYETVDSALVRHYGTNEVFTTASLPHGHRALRVTYTTGWTAQTLPADIRQALIELVGLKLQEVTNYSSDPADPEGEGASSTGTLKKVTAGGYTEEYAPDSQRDALWKARAAQLSRTIGASVPPSIEEVLDHYRVPFAV